MSKVKIGIPKTPPTFKDCKTVQEVRAYMLANPRNMAHREYYRTKGLSAWNFKEPVVSTRKLNQYIIETIFEDGSYLHVSSCKCLVDLNYMKYYNQLGEPIAQRQLF